MRPLDWAVLAALLLGPALLGTWRAVRDARRAARRAARRPGNRPPGDDGVGDPGDSGEKRERGRSTSMGVITVGLSLLASNLSGITLLGYPAEVYQYGSQFWMVGAGAALATAVLSVSFLPVLHGLKLHSSHEYLERRFDSRVRTLTSVIYTMRLLLLLPLVLYVPALAFNQVTGVDVYVIAPVISLVCLGYTTLGGLSAVVLTGSLQLLVMLVATVALLVAGLLDVGGVGVVWQRMEASGRLEVFNLDPSPLTRTTFWSATFGGAFFWLHMLAVQPNSVQRYLAVPTLAAARRTAYLQCAGLLLTTTLACSLGAVLYAKYEGCDPLSTREVRRADQLLALLVAETARGLPGLAGLFLAGLLSAAMGNLSAALNTLSHTLYADLVSRWLPPSHRPGLVTKALGVAVGLWATLLVLVVERLGGLVQVAMSVGSVTSGTMLGLFTLGMLVPGANALGALAGAWASMLFTALVVFGQQYAVAVGTLRWPTKPLDAHACTDGAATSLPSVLPPAAPGDVFPLFRVSYLWLVLLGSAVTVAVGSVVSRLAACQGAVVAPVDPSLLFAGARARQRQRAEAEAMLGQKSVP